MREKERQREKEGEGREGRKGERGGIAAFLGFSHGQVVQDAVIHKSHSRRLVVEMYPTIV